jgi:hypothetical protein
MALRKRRTGLGPLAFTSMFAASQLETPEVRALNKYSQLQVYTVLIPRSSRMWRHTVWKTATKLHCVTPLKTELLTFTKVRISNFIHGHFVTVRSGIFSTYRQNRQDWSVCCVCGRSVHIYGDLGNTCRIPAAARWIIHFVIFVYG